MKIGSADVCWFVKNESYYSLKYSKLLKGLEINKRNVSFQKQECTIKTTICFSFDPSFCLFCILVKNVLIESK